MIVAVNRNFEIFEFDVISIMWKKSDIFTFRICDKQLWCGYAKVAWFIVNIVAVSGIQRNIILILWKLSD